MPVAVVMAAGEGTRMRSALPKPLHRACGRPMLFWVLDAVCAAGAEQVVVVVGHDAERVTAAVRAADWGPVGVGFAEQRIRRGTADALAAALPSLEGADPDDDLLVLPGDAPVLGSAVLADLLGEHRRRDVAATVLTAHLDDPSGYGRVLRTPEGVRVVEERDATEAERALAEVNTSVYCFRHGLVAPALRRISPTNAQGEYYLPDVLGVLAAAGHRVAALPVPAEAVFPMVNDRAQLAQAASVLRRRINTAHQHAGVTMLDPAATYVDASVELGLDVTLHPGTVLAGRTVVGPGAEIGPATHLVDTRVGAAARVEATTAREADIGPGARVGPWVALAPGASIPAGATIAPHYDPRGAGPGESAGGAPGQTTD